MQNREVFNRGNGIPERLIKKGTSKQKVPTQNCSYRPPALSQYQGRGLNPQPGAVGGSDPIPQLNINRGSFS